MNKIEETKKGIERYLKIMRTFNTTDVSQDRAFQHLFNGFYQVRRGADWQRVFYSLMEQSKGTDPGIEDIIVYLQMNTEEGNVELSFASKLLHTIAPQYPIYDSNVADYFGLHNPSFQNWSDEQKINYQVENYNMVLARYQEPKTKALAELFDRLFPEYIDVVGHIKKIDFIIWKGLYKEYK